MTEDTTKKQEKETVSTETPVSDTPQAQEKSPAKNGGEQGTNGTKNGKQTGSNDTRGTRKTNGNGAQRGRGRKTQGSFGYSSRRGRKQQKSEFQSRVLSARRVSRVVAGGRRFSLSVAVAVGNGTGKVGIGVSKGQDMASAMEKARHQAQKNVVQIAVTDKKGIPSDAVGKFCASVVQVRPAKGFVAGGAVRTIAELAGIQYINAKIQSRSKSHLNNARAALIALQMTKI